MSQWSWVVFGYLVAYGGAGGYLLSLVRRAAAVRRRRQELP